MRRVLHAIQANLRNGLISQPRVGFIGSIPVRHFNNEKSCSSISFPFWLDKVRCGHEEVMESAVLMIHGKKKC